MDRVNIKNMKSQRETVINHLKQFGHLGMIEADDKYGIKRLAAIIFDLKKEGYVIEAKMIPCKNRFGEKRKVADYYLINE